MRVVDKHGLVHEVWSRAFWADSSITLCRAKPWTQLEADSPHHVDDVGEDVPITCLGCALGKVTA